MLLDSASLYFRAFFGVPTSVTAPDGTPVNAVRGLPRHGGDPGHRAPADPPGRVLGRRLAPGTSACGAIPSYKAHRLVAGHATTPRTRRPS